MASAMLHTRWDKATGGAVARASGAGSAGSRASSAEGRPVREGVVIQIGDMPLQCPDDAGITDPPSLLDVVSGSGRDMRTSHKTEPYRHWESFCAVISEEGHGVLHGPSWLCLWIAGWGEKTSRPGGMADLAVATVVATAVAAAAASLRVRVGVK